MKHIVGKFQMVNQTTEAGKKVTVVTGLVQGHLMSNDYKNHVLCELLVERMYSKSTSDSESPEDFLETIDNVNWADVLNN